MLYLSRLTGPGIDGAVDLGEGIVSITPSTPKSSAGDGPTGADVSASGQPASPSMSDIIRICGTVVWLLQRAAGVVLFRDDNQDDAMRDVSLIEVHQLIRLLPLSTESL